eukprot:UN00502
MRVLAYCVDFIKTFTIFLMSPETKRLDLTIKDYNLIDDFEGCEHSTKSRVETIGDMEYQSLTLIIRPPPFGHFPTTLRGGNK